MKSCVWCDQAATFGDLCTTHAELEDIAKRSRHSYERGDGPGFYERTSLHALDAPAGQMGLGAAARVTVDRSDATTPYGRRAMQGALNDAIDLAERGGGRNNALNGLGFRLGQLAGANEIDHNYAITTLRDFALGMCPDEQSKAIGTIQGSFRAGLRSPKGAPVG